ncbi:hypothetical protein L209DRAFT_691738 [Thermothelomyces heterothallicus CBS 203.75]
MTETLTPDEEAAAARAAEQARLRKARREAKIKAGAENRLNKITGLGGGFQRATSPVPAPATTAAAAATTTATAPSPAATATDAARPQHADPEEVDISEHFYQPRTTPRVAPANKLATTAGSGTISDAQLRQTMFGLDPPGPASPAPSMPGMPGMPPAMEDDPMMRLMMQMLGGGTTTNNNNNNNNNNPFGGGAPFPAQQQQQQQQQRQPTASPNRYASLWRLLHALIALALGLYIALYTPFTGTKLSRDRAAAAAAGSAEERARLLRSQLGQPDTADDTTAAAAAAGGDLNLNLTRNFFWAFATAEALLLGTRYLLFGRGQSPLDSTAAAGASGILGLVASFLPPGPRSKVELAMRYVQVLGTVRHDLLVCVFVLGVAAWLRG